MALVNNVAVSFDVKSLLSLLSVLWSIFPEVELLNHLVVPCEFHFWRKFLAVLFIMYNILLESGRKCTV